MAHLGSDNCHQALIAENMPLPPPPVDKLVHDVIKSHAIARPSSQAITSASINFTYQELDGASSWLASQITSLGIGFNSIVPIICEKV
jgi:non-ribosomal peptide synthetase component F